MATIQQHPARGLGGPTGPQPTQGETNPYIKSNGPLAMAMGSTDANATMDSNATVAAPMQEYSPPGVGLEPAVPQQSPEQVQAEQLAYQMLYDEVDPRQVQQMAAQGDPIAQSALAQLDQIVAEKQQAAPQQGLMPQEAAMAQGY